MVLLPLGEALTYWIFRSICGDTSESALSLSLTKNWGLRGKAAEPCSLLLVSDALIERLRELTPLIPLIDLMDDRETAVEVLESLLHD